MTRDVPVIQLQVNSPLDAPGGGAVHARGLARALRKRGIRVSVLCTGWSGYTDDGDFGNVIAARPRNLPLLWRRPPLGTLPFWVRTIRRNAAGVDAIVALSAEMAVASRIARRRTRVVYCPTALNGAENPGNRLTSFQRCERRAFRGAHGVVYSTDALRDAVELLYGPLDVPADVCPLGVDFEHIAGGRDVRAPHGIPPDAFVLLTVGVINENKGQALIARALANEAPADWWWIIVGDGPERPMVEVALRGTSLEARTLFVGNTSSVADWYATADVLVSASRCETFGLVIAEALAVGLPVVLPEDCPGAADRTRCAKHGALTPRLARGVLTGAVSPLAGLVESHELGRTFDRGRIGTLRAALDGLYGDARERSRMNERASEFARTHFCWDRYADSVLGLVVGYRSAGRSALVAPPVPPPSGGGW